MNRKSLAIGILTVWLAAMAWLVQREYFRAGANMLPDQPLNVSPSATYFRLSIGDVQVGFQSMSVDTLADTVRVLELMLMNLPADGQGQRVEARTTANLTRGLELRSFSSSLRADDTRYAIDARVATDSSMLLAIQTAQNSQDVGVSLDGQVTLPSLIPMQLAFGSALAVGDSFALSSFDPLLLDQHAWSLRVTAESTFVVPDSADQPDGQVEWIPARWDTVRAWRVVYEGDDRSMDAWIDDLGQIVAARTSGGFVIERTAYELAYENFGRGDSVPALPPSTGTEILHRTTTAAGVTAADSLIKALTVRLSGLGVDRVGRGDFQQRRSGDTLLVRTVDPELLRPSYRLPNRDGTLLAYRKTSPLLRIADPRIEAQARQAIGTTRNPASASEALVRWVHDAIDERAPAPGPTALDVLTDRRGDSNDQTTLFVALARAVGLPARPVSGLVYLRGRFYYHSWAEVYLRDWVAVDPTLGQWPADASHVRLQVDGLARHLDFVRIIGDLSLDVLEVQSE